jgi:menaquinone-9 beta-reductase
MPDRQFDVVVVGARVAGAALASLLGDAGHETLLVDRSSFPSPTLSTHFFRGGGLVSVLDQLGVLDDVLALGCPKLTKQYTYLHGGADAMPAGAQNPGDAGYCLSVRREPLDALLLDRARATEHVEVWEKTTVEELTFVNGEVAGVRVRVDGESSLIGARVVVGADGRHSTIARLAGPEPERTDAGCRALYYQYVEGWRGPAGEAPDAAEFSLNGDEIAYVFPSDSGQTCVALSVNLADYAVLRSDLNATYRAHIATHEGLRERFAASTPVSRVVGCGPEDSYVRVPWGPGWALVGDAALHQDPWTGMGMDCAGTHAAILAEELDAWLSGSCTYEAAMSRYHERRNAGALEGYEVTVSGARDLAKLVG